MNSKLLEAATLKLMVPSVCIVWPSLDFFSMSEWVWSNIRLLQSIGWVISPKNVSGTNVFWSQTYRKEIIKVYLVRKYINVPWYDVSKTIQATHLYFYHRAFGFLHIKQSTVIECRVHIICFMWGTNLSSFDFNNAIRINS